jgi:hypothetical protein
MKTQISSMILLTAACILVSLLGKRSPSNTTEDRTTSHIISDAVLEAGRDSKLCKVIQMTSMAL